MNKTVRAAPAPLILPWLAKRAGLSETRARELWSEAWIQAAEACGNTTSSEFFRTTVEKLEALMAAESRKLDNKYALRPWTRLQRGIWGLQLTWMEAGTAIAARVWRKNVVTQRYSCA